MAIRDADVRHWKSANRLTLNADKTELLWAGSRYAAAAVLGSSDLSLCLGDEIVELSDHV